MMLMMMMIHQELPTEAAIDTGRTGLWIFHDNSAYAVTYASLHKMTALSLSIAKSNYMLMRVY